MLNVMPRIAGHIIAPPIPITKREASNIQMSGAKPPITEKQAKIAELHRSLPPEPYEAAMLDGASGLQIFRRITLPLMSKVIAVAVLIRGIDLFRIFDYVFVMTSGGPGTATYTVSLYAWQQNFVFIKWGYGSTISLVTLALILLIANLFIWRAKVRW